jgi:aminopeptidase N
MDLYFARHDGQAVTCDDFRAAMADASGLDLTQFERWYSQAGTPVVEAQGSYDASAKRYSLTLKQSTPPTVLQPTKLPFHIPVRVGLLSKATGQEMVKSTVLELKEAEQTFHFDNVDSEPVPSILRGFSAPVRLRLPQQTEADLAFLMAHDTDPFNRWEASQQLASKVN